MSTKYCISCGTKHDYTLDVPKFCSNCGTPFGGVAQAKAPAKIEPKKESLGRNQEQDGDDEDADREVPQITKIEVEVEVSRAPKIVFGDAKKSMSFARDKQTKELSVGDLETRLETLFERDRKEQKEN